MSTIYKTDIMTNVIYLNFIFNLVGNSGKTFIETSFFNIKNITRS